MKKILKENKAITLIALVITIVVLIILAGVLINLTLGENGIFTRAKLAKERYEYGAAKEALEVKLVEIQTECLTESVPYTVDHIAGELGKETEETIDIMYYYETVAKVNSEANKSEADGFESIGGIVVIVNDYPKFEFLIGEGSKGIGIIGVKETTPGAPELSKFKSPEVYEEERFGGGGQDVTPTTPTPTPEDIGGTIITTQQPTGSIIYITLPRNTTTTLTVSGHEVATFSVATAVEGTTNSSKISLTGNTLNIAYNADTQDVITLDITENEQLLNKLVIYVEPVVIENAVTRNSVDYEDAYGIYTKQDLVRFRDIINNVDNTKNGILKADVNLSGINWIPIGSSSRPFTGIFDSERKTISNIYINSENDYQGLFGYIENAALSSFFVSGNVTGHDRVGAVAGMAKNSMVMECGNNAVVTGNDAVGGLVGFIDNVKIYYCYNKASITGNTGVGGIFGDGKTTGTTVREIRDSYNAGTIVANTYAGGISGFTPTYVNIIRCYNIENVEVELQDTSGNAFIGGISSYLEGNNNVNYCYNNGLVYNRADGVRTGGIIGRAASSVNINYCYNSGNVKSNGARIGGIVGDNRNGATINNCFVSTSAQILYCDTTSPEGKIGSGPTYVGYIAGHNVGSIDNNSNTKENMPTIYEVLNQFSETDSTTWTNETNPRLKWEINNN